MKTKCLHCEIRKELTVNANEKKVRGPQTINYAIKVKDNGKRFLEGDVWLVAKEGYNFDPANIEYFSDYYNRNWENEDQPEEMAMSYTVELEKNKWGMERMDITIRENDRAIIAIGME